MRIGNMEVIFHRTVRVPDGRLPSNLPPSLGRMDLYPVAKYAKRCPANWEKEAYFLALHETEAMWMSFRSLAHPVAMLVGAGGINALTGEKLGITLEKDNYLVAPPQPWLDGWKDKDGTVYQFVATAYQKGKGITVAEQLMGEESKTGAIGIAFFNPKEPSKLQKKQMPLEGLTDSIAGDAFQWKSGEFTALFSSETDPGQRYTEPEPRQRSTHHPSGDGRWPWGKNHSEDISRPTRAQRLGAVPLGNPGLLPRERRSL